MNWINIKLELPKDDGRYLVCINRKAPEHLGGNSRRIAILRRTSKGWVLPRHFPEWINDVIEEEVTHWQYLPELP